MAACSKPCRWVRLEPAGTRVDGLLSPRRGWTSSRSPAFSPHLAPSGQLNPSKIRLRASYTKWGLFLLQKNEARLLEKEHRKRVLGLQPSDAPASLLQPFMLPLPPGAQGPHTHLPAQFPFPLSSTLPHKSPSQPAPDSGASSISSWLLPTSQGPICLCFSPAFLLPTSTGSSIPKHTPPGPPSMACLAADIPRIEACFSWTVPPGSYGLSP